MKPYPRFARLAKQVVAFGLLTKRSSPECQLSLVFSLELKDYTVCYFCGDVEGGWHDGKNARGKHFKNYSFCEEIWKDVAEVVNIPPVAYLTAVYERYSSLLARRRSYTDWPQQIRQNLFQFAKAGFFYIGSCTLYCSCECMFACI